MRIESTVERLVYQTYQQYWMNKETDHLKLLKPIEWETQTYTHTQIYQLNLCGTNNEMTSEPSIQGEANIHLLESYKSV